MIFDRVKSCRESIESFWKGRAKEGCRLCFSTQNTLHKIVIQNIPEQERLHYQNGINSRK